MIIIPLVFWWVSYVVPSLVHPENLRLLAGIVTVLWTVDFVFFKKLGDISHLNLLSSKDLDNLGIRLSHIRKRVWWMAGWCLFCSIQIWIITGGELVEDVHLMALYVGALLGICASYLAVFPFWFNELQAFQDRLKIMEAEQKKRDQTLKQFANAIEQ